MLLPAPVSADPDKGWTNDGWTPCHAACSNGHPGAGAVLLEHGADPNRADKDGFTPCMIAAHWGRTASLRALAKGAAAQGLELDVNAVSISGDNPATALDLALARLDNDPTLLAVLGPELADAYLAVKTEEVLALGSKVTSTLNCTNSPSSPAPAAARPPAPC